MQKCECGSDEFITQLNSYDLYKLLNNKLEFQGSICIDEEIRLYCRECGREIKENTF